MFETAEIPKTPQGSYTEVKGRGHPLASILILNV